jgi:drug/metabolite transporter (DMT)-like permease/site-specific recombinase XerC
VKKSNGLLAVVAAIAANALWGSSFMASKVILAQCPPLTATLIRFSIAIALFAIIATIKKIDIQIQVLKSRLAALIGLGLIGYTGLYTMQMIALKHIASSQSAAIMLLAPVFTLIVQSALKGSIRGREAVTTAVGLLGAAAILFDQYKVDLSGIAFQGLILTTLASACLGVSVVQTKGLLAPSGNVPGFTVFNLTFYSLLIGVLGLLPFVVMEQHNGAHFVPLDCLSQILVYGVELDYLKENPVEGLKRLPVVHRSMFWLSKDQFDKKFLPAAAKHRDGAYRGLFEFAAYTGGRLNEVLPAHKDDINWAREELRLLTLKRRTSLKVYRYLSFKAIGPRLEDLLRRLKPHPETGYFFTKRNGEPCNSDHIDHVFRSVLDLAGLKDFRFHDLRHTYAMHRAMTQITFRQLQIELGHGSPQSIQAYLDQVVRFEPQESLFCRS